MTGRPSRERTLAVAYLMKHGHGPSQITAAAQKYGVSPSTLRRALAALKVPANPVGQPKKG